MRCNPDHIPGWQIIIVLLGMVAMYLIGSSDNSDANHFSTPYREAAQR